MSYSPDFGAILGGSHFFYFIVLTPSKFTTKDLSKPQTDCIIMVDFQGSAKTPVKAGAYKTEKRRKPIAIRDSSLTHTEINQSDRSIFTHGSNWLSDFFSVADSVEDQV